jgi:hypothetical protein
MTQSQIEQIIEEMLEYFGGTLPDPEHCPKQFAYYVKLFYYYKKR